MLGCALSGATLQALRIALALPAISDRSRRALSCTCSSLRSGSQDSATPSHRRHKARRPPPRVGVQLFGSGPDSGVSLLEWEPLQAAAGAGQAKAAVAAACEEFLATLRPGGKAPSADKYNKLMAELCRCQRFDLAWRLYCAGRRAGVSLRYNGLQRLVTLAAKAGDLSAAVEAFEDLKAAGLQPNKVTYCSLISALGKDKRRGVRSAALAYELWVELRASGEELDAAAYRIGMNACVGVGRLPEAKALLLNVAEAGEGSDVRGYNILLKAAVRAGDIAELPRLMARMAAAGVRPSSVSYNTLIEGYARGGAMAEAQAAMEQAVAAGAELDAWSYTSLLCGHVRAGNLGTAERVLADMRGVGVAPNSVTYSALLDGYVRAGDLGAARRILDDMDAAGQAPSVVTYNTLLRGYTSSVVVAGSSSGESSSSSSSSRGGLRAALEVLELMAARGVAPTTDTFNTLMAAAVAGGRPQLALDLHGRMEVAGLRRDALTYTTLLQAYSRCDRVADAMATFEALCKDSNVALDVPAYNAAVDVLARAGEMEAAERLAEAAERLAQKQGLAPPVEAYGALVAGYARLRLVTPAVEAVRRYHSAGGSPDVRMLESLADVCVRQGEYKVALQSVRALELLGAPVEKHKYRAVVAEAMRRQQQRSTRAAAASASGSAAWESADGWEYAGGGQGARRQPQSRRNVHLERFKFWLGLPNSYYSSSTDSDDEL